MTSSFSLYPLSFPESARFGKNIPKSRIYDKASASAKIKDLFVKQVDKITWSYKLSPETINLPAKDGVQEIQVFTLELKTDKLKQEVLHTIDKAIPSPILFVISFKDKIKYSAAYKRPSEADKSKWVISTYFETDWLEPRMDTNKHELKELPVVLNMRALYEVLLKDLIPLKAKTDESLQALLERVERLSKLKQEAKKLDKKLKKEKQFNRKVEINSEIKQLKAKRLALMA